jgi:hypothetical protein
MFVTNPWKPAWSHDVYHTKWRLAKAYFVCFCNPPGRPNPELGRPILENHVNTLYCRSKSTVLASGSQKEAQGHQREAKATKGMPLGWLWTPWAPFWAHWAPFWSHIFDSGPPKAQETPTKVAHGPQNGANILFRWGSWVGC